MPKAERIPPARASKHHVELNYALLRTSALERVCPAPLPTGRVRLSPCSGPFGCRFPVSALYEACSPIRGRRLFSSRAAVRPPNGLHPIPVRPLRLALGVTTNIPRRALIPPSARRPVGPSERPAEISTKAIPPWPRQLLEMQEVEA